MGIENLTPEDKARIKHVIKEGCDVLQAIKDQKESLNDLVNTVSKDLELSKKDLSMALKLAFKKRTKGSALEEEKETLDNVEILLDISGV